ncbi:cuticle protein 16.8 [Trichonephila clavipes]|nr:cuticle protein 16.8 [Trichonephila clavipes]
MVKNVGDGGHAVRESYGFIDGNGFHRHVHYVADKGSFRAVVETNEPRTTNQSPADVHLISDAPCVHGGYAENAGLGYAGRYGGFGYGALGILGGLGYESYGY